jgi:MFS family permease
MMENSPQAGNRGWRQTFAALRYPNYRLWFAGQLISLFGTWMQTTAQGFLIFELTRSPVYLGYIGFANGIPTWLLTLYGGVIADRLQRRTLLMVTQTGMMLLAFTLALLTFLQIVQPWHILLLAFLLGVANSFDAPSRQAFVTEMVGRDDLTNAIALNSTMFQSATVVGPAVAGVVYAVFGPAWCFVINGVSFVAVIVALGLMHLEPRRRQSKSASIRADLREALQYISARRTVRTLIALVAATSMFGLSLASIIPAWTVNVLSGDATVNGLLYSARGAGSLLGALVIASLGRFAWRGKLLTAGSFIFPAFLLAFAPLRWLPLSLLMLVGVGVGTILVLNLSNAIVQTVTPDRLRGRVMGAYTMIFFGFMPLGALWTGTIAENLGEPTAVVINACCMLLFASAVLVSVPDIRHKEH